MHVVLLCELITAGNPHRGSLNQVIAGWLGIEKGGQFPIDRLFYC